MDIKYTCNRNSHISQLIRKSLDKGTKCMINYHHRPCGLQGAHGEFGFFMRNQGLIQGFTEGGGQ